MGKSGEIPGLCRNCDGMFDLWAIGFRAFGLGFGVRWIGWFVGDRFACGDGWSACVGLVGPRMLGEWGGVRGWLVRVRCFA